MIGRFLIVFLMLGSFALAQHEDNEFAGQKAPELKAQPVWINSAPLKLDSLKGKVVLIEFWAFDCEFCAEATPHVKEWHQKYAKDGLVVIGVHTPRFPYEKEEPKLRASIKAKGIEYPVVVDNEFQIWSDYLCDVWPSSYLRSEEHTV